MAQKRNYKAEEQRRNELARARGFRNRAEERKFPRRVRNRRELEALPIRAQVQRSSVLRALSLGREDPNADLETAARRVGTTPEAVQWFAGETLERRGTDLDVLEEMARRGQLDMNDIYALVA